MSDRPIILISEEYEREPIEWLRSQAEVFECSPDDAPFDSYLAKAEGLACRTYTKVTPQFLDKAPKLRVIGRGGVGVENIDVKACRARGIEVVYTPAANTLAVGDFVFGYILQLIRPWMSFHEKAYEPKEFKRVRNLEQGRQLNELTLGVLGMGRIGRRVGHIATRGFGMKVIYNDLRDVAAELDFPATAVDKELLFSGCDILTIHVDMRPGNANLVGAPGLALMKPNALVINAARGEVLDAKALATALRAGKLGGAAIDVYAPEPPPADFPLLGLKNVILTPHMAARTDVAMVNMSWVVKDILGVLKGQPPQWPAP